MPFNLKNIFSSFLPAKNRKDFVEEKGQLSEFKEVTDIEKDHRRDLGLAFNSGKNPLKEKMEEVNYRMPKPSQVKNMQAASVNPATSGMKKEPNLKSGKTAGPADAKEKSRAKESIADKLHLGDAWQAPKILKTNLVKGEITTFIDWKRNINNLIITFCVSVAVVLFGYIGLIIMGLGIENKGRVLEGDIDLLKVQIIKAQDELSEIDKFQEKLKHAKSLMDGHVYWTNFFEFLENNLLPQTTIDGAFSGGPDGNYSFSLLTDNFESMTEQIVLLKSRPEVLSLLSDGGNRTVETTKSEDGGQEKTVEKVTYKINIEFDTKLFRKPEKNDVK